MDAHSKAPMSKRKANDGGGGKGKKRSVRFEEGVEETKGGGAGDEDDARGD